MEGPGSESEKLTYCHFISNYGLVHVGGEIQVSGFDHGDAVSGGICGILQLHFVHGQLTGLEHGKG